jgi:serine/threonine protein kinase
VTEETIFAAALDKTDPAERAAFLEHACSEDADLRRRVEGLIAAHEKAGSFLGRPAVAPDTDHATTRAFDGGGSPTARGEGAADPDAGDTDLSFLAAAGRPDSIGRLGHYEILQVLGKGGFGIVFRAFDTVLQRVVAVKVLAPQMAATSPARKRFIREAQSSAKIGHENVVRVHAVEEQPLPYLVMEFIPGETLQDKLDRMGPLDVPEVLRIARQIAEGLAAAHDQELIHRDIKPGNVMIEAGAAHRAKITDFGLARAADDASISQSGIVAGTPMYMAPEQAKGETLDHRADLFSLGSVLYAMLTGRPPFRANSTLAVLKRVAEDTPRPIREVIPEVPEWLGRVVEKLHAKDPADRYQSAREVADVLADCEGQLKAHGALRDFSRIPGGQPPPRRTRRRKWVWVAGVVVVLAGLGVWFGPFVLLYFSNRGELELRPADGLISVIVLQNDEGVIDGNKLHAPVTDWLDMKKRQTLKLPPGRYQLNVGTWPAGTSVSQWEVTTSDLFGSHTILVPVIRTSAIVTVDRGHRVTLRARMRTDPPRPTPPPPPSPDDGFAPLFNGKDLSGWETHPEQPGDWRVMDGVLVGTGPPSHLYTTRGDYENFHLRVVAAVSSGGNSGVFFRAGKQLVSVVKGANQPAGYEAQIVDSAEPNTYKTGSVINLAPAAENLIKPDEWFTLEVIARGNHIVTRIDGKEVVSKTDPLHTYKKGHFALQVWNPGTVVNVRQIEVKELPASPPPGAAADPAALQALRDAVAAKARNRDVVRARFDAGVANKFDLLAAEVELTEARHDLAAAQHEKAEVVARLQELVAHRQEERNLTAVVVEVGSATADALDKADARLAEAKARVAKAAPPRPAPMSLPTPEELAARPSPLDGLKREDVPADLLAKAGGGDPDKAPAGLVAVLGGTNGHTDLLLFLSTDRDGRTLASSSRDGLVKLWDLTTGRFVADVCPVAPDSAAIALSPDGKLLAAAAPGGAVKVWDTEKRVERFPLKDHSTAARMVRFSPDGRWIATGGADGKVRLWNASTGEPIWTGVGHTPEVTTVSFSPDGRTLASGADGWVGLWDVADGKNLGMARLPSPARTVRGLEFGPDGKALVVTTNLGKVYLWDAVGGKPLRALAEERGQGVFPLSPAWRADGRLVAWCEPWSDVVRLCDPTADPPRDAALHAFPASGQWVHALALTPDGRHLVTGNPDGSVYVIRLAKRGEVYRVP